MARRRITGDIIELDYNGRTLTFREDDDLWKCHPLKLSAKSLTALKRKVDKLDGEARRVSCPAIRVDHWGHHAGTSVRVVLLAKQKDWESLRYDEKPELLAGLQSRRVPTVWIMEPRGNRPAERRKVRLDELAPPTESTTIALREYERLTAEAKRLSDEADAVLKGIPRLTMDDLTVGKVAEENLED